MNKLAVTLVLIFSALIAGVALSLDNDPRPTPAQEDEAFERWHNMLPEARDVVCNLYEMTGRDAMMSVMLEEGLGQGHAQARIDLMESECN